MNATISMNRLQTVALAAFLAQTTFAASDAPLAKLRAIPFPHVTISDSFWAPRRETNRVASIPANLDNLEKAGNIRNLELAAAKATSGFTGPVFMDSDVYKALEAAAYSLATHPDPELEKRLDRIIAAIAGAQQPDGYLNSYFVVKEPTRRWTNLRDWHELYCAGHLFEGAVAHFQATGKRNFLDVAIKLADHIDSVFGGAPGKRMGYPGHPEIELALIKLWGVTGERRYFELARFFIESRGQKFFLQEHRTPLDRYDGSYWQDDVPICDHKNIKGHAVRAAYLLSGATDVAGEIGHAALLKMIRRVWRNTTEKNMFITGGIGPSAHNEGFTVDYDLPNLTAYQETCATIALAQWNHRLALLHGDAAFADVMERALYNGVLAGVSQDGNRFFYVNPLASRGTHHRSTWFSCACCPPNVARTLASLGGYAYGASDDAIYVNLYIQGSARTKVRGQNVTLDVATQYPWEGKVTLKPRLSTPAKFGLRLRVPDWCADFTIRVNREAVANPIRERGYLVLDREWRSGDEVQLQFEMPAQRIVSHPGVKGNQGFVALQRGPLVYCFESCDHSEPLAELYLPERAELRAELQEMPNGRAVVLKGIADVAPELEWTRKLYQPFAAARRVEIKAIPYYLWDNRKPGSMQVWLPLAPPVPAIGGLEQQAKVTVSFANSNSQPEGIHDGIEPKRSGEQPSALCHWWPHRGREEWVQYTWKKPVSVSGARTYWFDDTARGACRLPASWQIHFLENGEWKPVQAKADYAARLDQWCDVTFEPVTTTALRLSVTLQPEWAAGVHEWKIVACEDEW